MNNQTQSEVDDDMRIQQGFYSCITAGFGIPQDDNGVNSLVMNPNLISMDKTERMQLTCNDLKIGKRIHAELKQQGRSVSWLAKQLDVERTGLYYTFRQNSIDLALLLRISFHLQHNFMQDVVNVYKSYGL